MQLKLRHRVVERSHFPVVMGVLNVTPDSFSDGGKFNQPENALQRALEMIEAGADMIDVGPESTRPGSSPVPPEVQLQRAISVIRDLRRHDDRICISIDTRLAEVASAALDAGADIINDVSALRDDPAMADLAASSGAGVVLMHRLGTSRDMQKDGGPYYKDVIQEICGFLRDSRDFAVSRGIDASKIILDPGIGFGKRAEHNFEILRHVESFVAIGNPVLIGASRKSFLSNPTIRRELSGSAATSSSDRPRERLAASLACAVLAAIGGAAIIRAHDVAETIQAVNLVRAVCRDEGRKP